MRDWIVVARKEAELHCTGETRDDFFAATKGYETMGGEELAAIVRNYHPRHPGYTRRE